MDRDGASGYTKGMAEEGDRELRTLLRRAAAGDPGAAEALVAATYGDLQALARTRLRRTSPMTLLDTAGLVNEWYERFARQHRLALADRAHFLAHAGRVMRSIIVDHVRRRTAARRGGGVARVPLEDGDAAVSQEGEEEILRVHAALEELARLDPRLARVVDLRYFAGLTELEIARMLGVTDRTVRRDWEKARLWLAAAMRQEG